MVALLTGNSRDATIFIEGKDVHQVKAEQLGTTRSRAKTINHGLNYGMGKELLSRKLRLPLSEGEQLVAEFCRLHPYGF